MSESSATTPESQEARSHARGVGFLLPLMAAWPIGLLIGAAAILLGAGPAVGIASGLTVALGLSFAWIAITFAMDDGAEDDRVRAEIETVLTAVPVGDARSHGRVVHEPPGPAAFSRGRVVHEAAEAGARPHGRVVLEASAHGARK